MPVHGTPEFEKWAQPLRERINLVRDGEGGQDAAIYVLGKDDSPFGIAARADP